jgi:ATP-dependent DNA helicase RecG
MLLSSVFFILARANKMINSIQHLLEQGEGLTVEFKKAKEELPSNLFETVCAFLNRAGGNILLGVNDDKTIEGVNPAKAETFCKNIVNLSNNPQKLFPTFLLDAKTVEYAGKTLIHIFVPISSQVHKSSNKIYDRSADGDFELKSDEQIKKLYNRKSILYTENKIYPFTRRSFCKRYC